MLLPDGSVLAVGGGVGTSGPTDGGIYSGPIYTSPGASAFRTVDAQQEARTYHATALLLPDGRVLSAGDDRSSHASGAARNAEIYSPPYILRGARPQITFAPSTARYDAPIRVATPDPATIARAVLMRPSSVTQVADMDQRSVTLALTAERGGLTLRTPKDATVAPPGYYMPFLLDRDRCALHGALGPARSLRSRRSGDPRRRSRGRPGAAVLRRGRRRGWSGGRRGRGDARPPGRVLTVRMGPPSRRGRHPAGDRAPEGERGLGGRVRLALGRRFVVRTLRATDAAGNGRSASRNIRY